MIHNKDYFNVRIYLIRFIGSVVSTVYVDYTVSDEDDAVMMAAEEMIGWSFNGMTII